MKQHDRIRQYLDDFGSITPMQAFYDLSITKLSTRICEMERKGYKVKRERIKTKNRYGEDVNFMKYTRVDEQGG